MHTATERSHFKLMNPFGELFVDLSPSELRETAYEVLVAACRSLPSGKPLTYASGSSFKERSQQLPARPSMDASAAEGTVKGTLGLQLKGSVQKASDIFGERRADSLRRDGTSFGEFMRVQMRVSEQTDSRIRRGLMRVASAQLGRRVESMVLPLELLRQFRISDFSSEKEYDAWQRRYLKVLEAGLLLHPSQPPERAPVTAQRLRKILYKAFEKPNEILRNSESMGILCTVVNSHACSSGSDMCHWADGVPLNLHLYKILLESCFDVNDESTITAEVDDVLDQIKKTWLILGINQEFHNLCFCWVMFHRFVTTGENKDDLLFGCSQMVLELEKDGFSFVNNAYLKILSSILDIISDWTRTRLNQYQDAFYRGNIDLMQVTLSLGICVAKMVRGMTQKQSKKMASVDVACELVEAYIRSSMNNAFVKEREKLLSNNNSSTGQRSVLPFLSILAQNICDMAYNEKEIYSPVLKKWHPVATGVAVATLHSCYANELKKFILGTTELTPEAIQVLLAAEKLEKDLVQMAVIDSVDSEDGGKAIIQEMTPYEAEAAIGSLVKSWIQARVDRLGEWIERMLQKEEWNPRANQGRFAPSATELLRLINEMLEAFFLLPISNHPSLLPDLMMGLDKCIEKYIMHAVSGCGSRLAYIPSLPGLSRCTTSSKKSPFKRPSDKKSYVQESSENGGFSLARLCLCINTFYHTLKELEVFEKRIVHNLKNIGFAEDNTVAKGEFILSRSSFMEGIRQLSEATAYRVVFHDLKHAFWDFLYIGEISSSRIEPFMEELERHLEVISSAVHDRVRTHVITSVMKASFDGFLYILLAGGPSRTFTLQDGVIITEDFNSLADLFWSNGDGLPADLISKLADNINGILSLFQTSTEDLIKKLRSALNVGGASANSRLPLPSTSGEWSPSDPNTILRVLCYRKDKVASKFLKRTYGLPKAI